MCRLDIVAPPEPPIVEPGPPKVAFRVLGQRAQEVDSKRERGAVNHAKQSATNETRDESSALGMHGRVGR